MKFKEGIVNGTSEKIYNFLKDGLDLAEISVKLNVRMDMCRRLLYYEMKEHREFYEPMLIQTLEVPLSPLEMNLGGESFISLYLPYYEEKQIIIKKSKL